MDATDDGFEPAPPGGLEDAAAFELATPHLARVMADQAFRLLGDRGRGEDVVQEALLQMWQHRERFDPRRGSVTAWALAIVRNLSVDRIRHDQAAARREELFAARARPVPYDEVLDAVECVLEHERVRLYLRSLTDLQRQAVHLVYFDRLGIAEAAARLGIPAPTLRTRLRDARTALEQMLRME
ncbi:sigma-70 family RNA polymerase sigma factor [Catenulispora yoronensis]|uniref:Sigma-70 family RNA polymerase sigma factor n=1 Tax=Catenulispora yoronensis TaxID=450799 RepID=A0ABP5GTJ2_9ACTN